MKYSGFMAAALCAALFITGCSRDRVKVDGRFVGYYGQNVYLEMVQPENRSMIDSAVTDSKGYFKLRADLPYGEPTIYNVWCDGDFVPLIVEPGDRVKLYAIGSIPDYTVEGSAGSERLRELKKILSAGATRMDSITSRYNDKNRDVEDKELRRAFMKEMFRTKHEQIAFIVTDPGSLASLYALYQRLPGDPNLMDGRNDIIYYRQVADSAERRYPGSPYVKALRNEIATAESQHGLTSMLSEKLNGERDGFPEITLPDIYGNKHRLTDLKGKVILLDFWTSTLTGNQLLTAEMKEIYARFAPQGFEIYQVALDTDKLQWITAVQNLQVPWINVCDLRGADGVAVRTYNVRSIPANFLIDREGNIAGADIFGQKLEQTIERLVRK